MRYWFDTEETIPAGCGFAHFGTEHLLWLLGLAVFITLSCILYRRLSAHKRKLMRYVYAALILANELFKITMLLIGDRFLPRYLPFHLCSINIFLILIHVLRPSKGLDNFLYTACIPGALAALLFPTWSMLPPLGNFMVLHSFTIHALLIVYPLMQFTGGDLRPSHREIGHCLLILLGLAVISLCANLVFDTNFMFLMRAEPGTPLVWFAQHWGSHLPGFPVLIGAVLLVMHGPLYLVHRKKYQIA